MPNPFGASTGNNETQIPFDIGADNTAVTIRILDVSGKEIARPIDNQIFGQGRYTTTVSSSSLVRTEHTSTNSEQAMISRIYENDVRK